MRRSHVTVELCKLEETPERGQADAAGEAEHEEHGIDDVSYEGVTRRGEKKRIPLAVDTGAVHHGIDPSQGRARKARLPRGLALAHPLRSGRAIRLQRNDHLG